MVISILPSEYSITSTATPNPRLLHKKFVELGSKRHKLKNEMLAILPEIYKSGIYKKYATTIIEYAGKYGDIAKTTVIKRLRLEENLEGKPCLKAAIKEVGIHKIAMVAKLATPKNDYAFADKVKNMSKSAIQTLSKEIRQKAMISKSTDLLTEDQPVANPAICHAATITIKIELDPEMAFLFLKLKKKMGKNLSNKDTMKLILEKMNEINEQKNKAQGESVTGEIFGKNKKHVSTVVVPRYIAVKIKKSAMNETDGRCSYPGCNKLPTIFHHRDRFCKSKNHSSITPLCGDHHEFMHNGLVSNEEKNCNSWQLKIENFPEQKADIFYRKYRRKVFA